MVVKSFVIKVKIQKFGQKMIFDRVVGVYTASPFGVHQFLYQFFRKAIKSLARGIGGQNGV